jgi:hypothetical protein
LIGAIVAGFGALKKRFMRKARAKKSIAVPRRLKMHIPLQKSGLPKQRIRGTNQCNERRLQQER